MSNINRNNLLSLTVSINIHKAMKEAVKHSLFQGGRASSYVKNRKGANYLRVTYCRKMGFSFWTNSSEITSIVLSVLSEEY